MEFTASLPADLPAGRYEFVAMSLPLEPDGFSHVEIDVEPIWRASADASELVRDDPGITVDTHGIPLRHRSAISYPPEAIAQGIEGTVEAEIIPTFEGEVEGVHILSGPVVLSRHVIQALGLWHYAEGVGNIKARRVTITFGLAAAKARPLADRDQRLVDNLPISSWTSGDRNRLFKLRKISILGISEDVSAQIRAAHQIHKLFEGAELKRDQLYMASIHRDPHLRTYFWREGSEITVTIAPIGFIAGEEIKSPPIETEPIRPGEDPDGPIRVSAKDQARKLISKVPPQYPGNSDWDYVQGVVRVVFTVGKDGRVIEVSANCHHYLQRVAEEAVKQWVYSPTVVNGHPVEVRSEVYLDFFLPY
jgi:outer membrane biosynthesis protein TonB